MLRFVLLISLALSRPSLADPTTSSDTETATDLLLQGRLSDALPAARAAALADPNDLDAQELWIDLMHSVGYGEQAEKHYRDLVAQNPLNVNLHYLRGRAETTGPEAAEAYEAALRLAPDHARSHRGMGAVHRAEGDFDAAEAAYKRALAKDRTLSEAYNGLLATLVSKNDIEQATVVGLDAIQAVPFEADAYLALAILQPDQALGILEKAVQLVPRDPRTHATYAEHLLAVGRGAEALQAAERALTIDSSHASSTLSQMYARCMAAGTLDASAYSQLVALQKQQPPSSAYTALINDYGQCNLTWMGRAWSYSSENNLPAARADLERALQLDPANVEAHGSLGLLLLKLDEPAKAMEHLSIALDARPRDPSLAIALADAANATGDRGFAIQKLAFTMDLYPNDVRVILKLAGLLAENGQKEDAYAMLRDAVSRTGDGHLLLALAGAARDLGRVQEAANILEQLGTQLGSEQMLESARNLRAGIAP